MKDLSEKAFLQGLYSLYKVYKKADWKNGQTFEEWLKHKDYIK